MIELDYARCIYKPFNHQKDGVRLMVSNPRGVDGVQRPVAALFDEPGMGKSKQVIDTACFLYLASRIDTVVVIAPATVRAVWCGEFGQIREHAFVHSSIWEYHAKGLVDKGRCGPAMGAPLVWIVTNFEFLRDGDRLNALGRRVFNEKTWMVVDESSRIKSHKASQTKAVWKMRKWVDRASILNGTPVANNPLDLYAQMRALDESILGAKSYFHFRARYALMGGYMNKQVVGFQHLEEVQDRTTPYILRRLKKDCLDLPEKTFTFREVPLDPPNWKIYRQMRDEMVAWLDGQASIAGQAVVKGLRLAQVTSGFLGGFTDIGSIPKENSQCSPSDVAQDLRDKTSIPWTNVPKEIGDEKLRAVLEWLQERVEGDPLFKCIIWCRFRAELERTQRKVQELGIAADSIMGGQTDAAREATMNRFQRESGPLVLVGQPQAGGLGLTLTAAHDVVYMSNDFNLLTRLQSEDRVHRPGQKNVCTYLDVIATGPDGQKTVDHLTMRALKRKEDLANWTASKWRAALMEE